MKIEALIKARSEALKFVECADALLKARKDCNYSETDHVFGLPKEQGAVKRSSMDLTRALSELRKPGY